ncbi:CPBP family intramembrane glutamic endopeptidase [Natrinema sp. 1APR25-10V2]|uniref:CPBP family intramembrane glutamic endopeptidase n=1 Tax=Natrinema sp. 1APR25-10V2 TaxID=2951081 RepID=UPI002875DA75|nr:CPBP family intramembrane glutamic endopeptidase [Natrinema sp. 1APR25-10V2]MDS0476879.1 CPBP family intramembrane metalloprotease [Natrinema sp. 1APR25-10V2]
MTDPDHGRLGLFVGILLVAAAALVLIAASANVSPITLAPAYMFSPMVAGLAVCLSQGIPLADVGLRRGRLRWLAAAAVVALPLIGLTLVFAVAVPGIAFDPTADPIPGAELPPGLLGVVVTIGIALVLGSTVNAVFAFGEEFGWRGYLLWELAPWGFWKASFAIGSLWGLWHTPVIVAGYNYPSFPYIGVIAMTIACLSFSPLYTYIVIRAQSVLAAAILHGVFNGSAGLVVVYAAADGPVLEELVASPVGAAGVLAFGFATIAIAVFDTPTLTRKNFTG